MKYRKNLRNSVRICEIAQEFTKYCKSWRYISRNKNFSDRKVLRTMLALFIFFLSETKSTSARFSKSVRTKRAVQGSRAAVVGPAVIGWPDKKIELKGAILGFLSNRCRSGPCRPRLIFVKLSKSRGGDRATNLPHWHPGYTGPAAAELHTAVAFGD